MANILVESIKHGTIVEFTPEQWENMKRTGHSRAWRVLSAEGLLPEKDTPKIVDFSKVVEKFDTHLDIEYQRNDLNELRKKLDDAGVKYNHRISDPLKLKAIWEKFNSNYDLGT